MPIDTAAVTFVVRPADDENGELVRGRAYERAHAVANILVQHFVPPAAVILPKPRAVYLGGGPFISAMELSADFDLWLDSNGRITGVEWRVASRTPELVDAVLRALRAADSAMAFVQLREPVNVPIHLLLTETNSLAADDQRLMPLRIAYYPMEQPVQIQSIPEPKYPREPRKAGLEGRVVLQYVVGANGRVVPSTLWVVSATDDRFIAAASAAVLHGKFRPASGHGCRLSMIVRQGVGFKLEP